jgi:phospholipase C
MKRVLRLTTTLAALSTPALAQQMPMVTPQPSPGPAVAPHVVAPENAPVLSRDQLIEAVRNRVRYVFVIFNENHSFDNEFGTFPGVNGLYADPSGPRDAAHTPGFTQTYKDVNGQTVSVQPFRIGPEQNSTFVDSVDHTHAGLAKKIDVKNGVAQMDGFAMDEYTRFASKGGANNEAMGTQFARLVMSHIDCDTIPFFWNYANRFTIFDNIFATEDTPSAPNAIAMIAGQSGETQWVKHGPQGQAVSANGVSANTQGPPIVNDPQPFWGSQFDPAFTDREPRGSTLESYADNNIASNLTFATVPLTLAGNTVKDVMSQDRAPASDLADISGDIPFIADRHGQPVAWRWYENGYDHEPTDAEFGETHQNYVSHHNGAQYFGYIANNPSEQHNLRGEGDFFDDIANGNLPVGGGVFYIRGGFDDIFGQTPPIQNPRYPNPNGLTPSEFRTIENTKTGDDDHPAYSDRQISESMAARVINAIASRPAIWNQSLILITYDESDGFYDHVPPRILSYGPDGLPLARGVRIPMLMISPFARAHMVSHAEGDHNAVIETIEAIFNLPPLASLPEEKAALLAGQDASFNGPNGFVQHYLGPRDLNSPITDDLLSGFEPGRLMGQIPPLPGSYAMISEPIIQALPHFGGHGCQAIGMTPTDVQMHIPVSIPSGFNTLPATLPAYNQ